MAGLKRLVGQIAYASLFLLLWPGLLACCAIRLDASEFRLWAQPLPPSVGALFAVIGISLAGISMWALWRKGSGLPMNAFPPPRLVASSTYAVFSHPIYVGFTLLVAGAAVVANSAAGFWLITPLSALASAALVFGYEGPDLQRRFGSSRARPLFSLPAGGSDCPSLRARLLACLTAFGPWALLYALMSQMPAPEGAVDELRVPWEFQLSRPGWAIWVYSVAYAMAPASVLLVPSNAVLRRFVKAAWAGTAVGFFVMLAFPAKSALLALDSQGLSAWLTQANRWLDADWLAFPSFHAFWVVLAALALQSRGRLTGSIGTSLAVAVAVSCVLSGSHAIVDVAGGSVLAFLSWDMDALWKRVVRAGSRLSNSWCAVRVGPVRIISHFPWSFAGAAVGTSVVLYLGGPALLVPCLAVIAAGILFAGAWGYWLEGGDRLSRPFGYYGYLFGTLFTLAALCALRVDGAGTLAGALAAGAPVAQAVGRLRCIVQGCCHGRPTTAVEGFRVTHACSRVTALSGLHGVAVHPTQLYSIVGNIALGILLGRLWFLGATWPIVGGAYLILSSLARFVEEQYRGEPQTPWRFGLAIYQWLAALMLVTGLGIVCVPGAPVHMFRWISWETVAISAVVAWSPEP